LTAQAFAPLTTLVLGGKLKVETMKGHKTVRIKAGTAPGSKIRIKGEGVPKRDGKRGNLYVTLQPEIPNELDEEQQALFEQLRDLGL
jgi:curved DNA-binding protein